MKIYVTFQKKKSDEHLNTINCKDHGPLKDEIQIISLIHRHTSFNFNLKN